MEQLLLFQRISEHYPRVVFTAFRGRGKERLLDIYGAKQILLS